MKKFEKFLTESQKPIKQFGDNTGKVNKPNSNIPPTDQTEIGRRRTAQDNLRRNVYKDLDVDGGELQGNPTTDTNTTKTNTTKTNTTKTNTNKVNTNKIKTNTTNTNTTKVDVKTRMSDAFDRNKKLIPKKNQIVNNKVINTNKVDTNKINTNKINTNKINTNTNQRVIDINKKLASNKINTNINTTVPEPKFGKVTNINVNKGVNLPNITSTRQGVETVLTQNQIQSKLDDIQNKNFKKLERQNANNILKNLDTSDTDKLIPDKNVGKGTVVKPGDPIPDKKIKGAVKSYRDFMKNVKNVNKVVKRTAPYLKGLTRVAVPVATALSAKGTYDDSRRAGMSKQRSLGRTLARGAGQIIGSAIGGTAGAIGGGGVGSLVTGGLGAYAGYDLGGSLATKAFDTFTTRSGRRQFGKSFSNFRKDLMNVDTNTLKKVNNQLNKK